MKTPSQRCIALRLALALLLTLSLTPADGQSTPVDVWTWHNDNWRTGQNNSEASLTLSNVNSTNFGKVCSSAVDGQVYAQPLVLGNATINGVNHTSVAYVATMNDSLYLFDGTNCSPIASAVTGTSTSLIPSGEVAVDCHSIGGMNCTVVSPKVGILGTPVIDERTNHIYVVTYSSLTQSGVTTYYHRLHALFTGAASGTTPLAEDTAYNSPVVISSGNFTPTFVSFTHIQRPGLLLLPSTENPAPVIYVAFSMMDGAASFPPGFTFRYTGDDLSQAPLVYTTEPTTGKAGGGIWMDGAGLSAGLDSTGGNTYLYVTTADGDFDSPNGPTQHCVDCGDSFVKLGTSLGVSSSFTPADQACRFINNPLTNPDQDFGSGGVLLIPDSTLASWPYLAISADKNQNIWVMQRSSPGFYNGGTTCTNGTNANLEALAGTGLYHNTPAFWSAGSSGGYLYYSSDGGVISQYPVLSSCTSGSPPLCNVKNTSTDPSNNPVTFWSRYNARDLLEWDVERNSMGAQRHEHRGHEQRCALGLQRDHHEASLQQQPVQR